MNFIKYLLFFIVVVMAWVIGWELCDKILFPFFRNQLSQFLYFIILIALLALFVGIIYLNKNEVGLF